MKINMTSKEGVTLLTQDKYCAENIEVVPTFETGGGSGGGLAVEVNELPTENIDESKIYLVNKTELSADIYICMDGVVVNMQEAGFVTAIQIVQSLDDVETPDETTAYIVESTGYVYAYMGEWMLFTEALGGTDYGWVQEVPQDTSSNWVCAIKVEKSSTTIGTADEQKNRTFFVWYNSTWQEVTMPYAVTPIIDFGEGIVFSSGGVSYKKITNDSFEELYQQDDGWVYKKYSANSYTIWGSGDTTLKTYSANNFVCFQKISNGCIVMVVNELSNTDNTVVSIYNYIHYQVTRDLARFHIDRDGEFNYWGDAITLEEWNAKIAEVGVPTT